jgi:acyl dehydratase
MSMMGWLAAVDEYSPTHYDPDFAKSHRYGGGRNIVAGPQLASVMVAALEESLGPSWWITDYENVQRRAVYPNETLISFSRVRSIRDGTATVHLWLVNEEGVVKGTGNATVKAVTTERKVSA